MQFQIAYYICSHLVFLFLHCFASYFCFFSCFRKRKGWSELRRKRVKEKKISLVFYHVFKTYENKVYYYASSLFEVLDGKENLGKKWHTVWFVSKLHSRNICNILPKIPKKKGCISKSLKKGKDLLLSTLFGLNALYLLE